MPQPGNSELSRLLDAGLDMPEALRDRWIEELPGQLDPLKVRLRNLLLPTNREHAGGFLDTLPKLDVATAMTANAEVAREAPGTSIGNYRLERMLGEGGMASVWLARRIDGLIDRPVALKIPHGTWQRAELAQRMAREREILATLDHPNISKLYDAGLTADGKPYLALEYFEGLSIDAYCEARRLGVRDRLRLFEQMANAVAYSHAKLVLHRDLKPANILVSPDGQVRLLDFGIARLLDDGQASPSSLTELTGRVLTPDYASPEQISGAPITVASDIYSLGVVLYELLTGVRPCTSRHDSRAALEQAILQTEPRRPSEVATATATRRVLTGDLDSIVLKTLRKRPDERYATANALTDDVRRYLSGCPVQARTGNTGYRLRRFLGRHRVAVAASAGILLAFSISAGVAVWQARLAMLERARAEAVRDFVVSLLQQTNPYARKDGAPISAVDMLTGARAQVEHELSHQPQVAIALLTSIAESFAGLGQHEEAAHTLEQALRDVPHALGNDSVAFVRAHRILSEAYAEVGRYKEARRSLNIALASPLAGRPGVEAIALQLQKSVLALEDAQFADALEASQTALRLARVTPEAGTQVLAQAWRYEAVVHRALGDAPRAIDGYRRAYDLALQAYDQDVRHPFVMETRMGYARALMMQNRWREAIGHMSAAVDAATQTFGADASLTGNFLLSLGDVQVKLGDIREGLENCRKSLDIHERHASKGTRAHAARLRLLGRALLAAQRPAEAAPLLAQAVAMRSSLDDPYELPAIQAPYALALIQLGRLDEAATQLAKIDLAGDKVPQAAIVEMLLYRGTLHRHRKKYSAALVDLDRALTLARSMAHSEYDQAQILNESGQVYTQLSQHETALAYYRRATKLFRQAQWRTTPALADSLAGSRQALLAVGR